MTPSKDREIFVIADTHFGHGNILKFKRDDGKLLRDFRSIQEHDECIKDNWNSLVRDQDIVYVLGDVGIGDMAVLKTLTGRKRLILGNHDTPSHPTLLEVFKKRVGVWRMFPEFRCVLTHVPVHLSIDPEDDRVGYHKYIYNIHGHTHDKPSPTPNHFCVSVEQTEYKPVRIQDVLRAEKVEE